MKDFVTSWNEVPVIMELPFAAELLGMAEVTLKKRSQKGTFPAFKAGGKSWRVGKDDLLRWIEEQKSVPGLVRRGQAS